MFNPPTTSHMARKACLALCAFAVLLLFAQTDIVHAAGVVGNGTAASCTEATFDAAIAGGGNVTFNCGADPVVIPLTKVKTWSGNATLSIDGGDKVTLKAQNSRHFRVNEPQTLNLANIIIQAVSDDKPVGGIDNNGKLNIDHTDFKNNHTGYGSAISNQDKGVVDIKDSNFVNNRASSSGGAISNFGKMTLTNVTATNNKAKSSGGFVYQSGEKAKLTINNSTITESTASSGGAIMNLDGDISITGSTFSKNTAGRSGAIQSEGLGNAVVTIKNSKFSENQADESGAIYTNATLNITNSTFADNNAGGNGGALQFRGTTTIETSTFTGNFARQAGAIFQQAGNLSINRSTLSGNTSSTDAGALFIGAPTTIVNSTFGQNFAGKQGIGGAIFFAGDRTSITYSTFAENRAAKGAAIGSKYVQRDDKLTLQNTILGVNAGSNCSGPGMQSLDNNVSADATCTFLTGQDDKQNANPKLGALSNNGGPTQTYVPLAGSPAFRGAEPIPSILIDQRGITRPKRVNPTVGSVQIGDTNQ